MEWYHWIMVGFGVVGFITQTVLLAVGGTWKLAQIEARITGKITDHRTEIDGALDAAQKAAIERADLMRREFGETVMALRNALNLAMTELHQTRQWALETFSRRDSVNSAMDRIDKRLERIDDKLDKMSERNAQ